MLSVHFQMCNCKNSSHPDMWRLLKCHIFTDYWTKLVASWIYMPMCIWIKYNWSYCWYPLFCIIMGKFARRKMCQLFWWRISIKGEKEAKSCIELHCIIRFVLVSKCSAVLQYDLKAHIKQCIHSFILFLFILSTCGEATSRYRTRQITYKIKYPKGQRRMYSVFNILVHVITEKWSLSTDWLFIHLVYIRNFDFMPVWISIN
jgi:hypothetical protein